MQHLTLLSSTALLDSADMALQSLQTLPVSSCKCACPVSSYELTKLAACSFTDDAAEGVMRYPEATARPADD